MLAHLPGYAFRRQRPISRPHGGTIASSIAPSEMWLSGDFRHTAFAQVQGAVARLERKPMVSLGIDIGGTFTDFVAYDRAAGGFRAWKNQSTPQDPTDGILTGLRSGEVRISEISNIKIGTTVVTNALLEGNGATVGYITTSGFKDIPFIGRGNRRHHYDLTWIKPKPFVKRRHCYEVQERIGADGKVIRVLDEAGVRMLARKIREQGEIEAIAVMLMHSYIEPAHERRIREILAEMLPAVAVSISYDVLPKWKEYFRSSTTICDAFVRPVVERQLRSLRVRLAQAGVEVPIVVMRSNGGEMTIDAACAAPIQMAVSGPTGGVIAAKYVASLLRIENVVTLDMGGTSTDISTIVAGKERFTTEFEIEWGRPVQIPMIDIRTIGAGGGSLAHVDAGGMLVVGPQSAGALPGPASYGRGGTEPTVTDANLLLGRISADNFLGGKMALNIQAARAAVAKVAENIGFSVEEAALAIIRIANNTMVGALHTSLTEQGLDLREFTLMAFGGAGPLHICDLMDETGLQHGIVPNFPGQFSALGFTLADARVDRHRTVQLSSKEFDRVRAEKVMAEIEAECRSDLVNQGHKDIVIRRSIEMRYVGQNYELEVPTGSTLFGDREQADLWNRFHAQHFARYNFRLNDAIEIVTFVVTGFAATAKAELPKIASATGQATPKSRRRVWFNDRWIDTPIYDRVVLRAGDTLDGPALVEEEASVTVVSPNFCLTVDGWGNLEIRKRQKKEM